MAESTNKIAIQIVAVDNASKTLLKTANATATLERNFDGASKAMGDTSRETTKSVKGIGDFQDIAQRPMAFATGNIITQGLQNMTGQIPGANILFMTLGKTIRGFTASLGPVAIIIGAVVIAFQVFKAIAEKKKKALEDLEKINKSLSESYDKLGDSIKLTGRQLEEAKVIKKAEYEVAKEKIKQQIKSLELSNKELENYKKTGIATLQSIGEKEKEKVILEARIKLMDEEETEALKLKYVIKNMTIEGKEAIRQRTEQLAIDRKRISVIDKESLGVGKSTKEYARLNAELDLLNHTYKESIDRITGKTKAEEEATKAVEEKGKMEWKVSQELLEITGKTLEAKLNALDKEKNETEKVLGETEATNKLYAEKRKEIISKEVGDVISKEQEKTGAVISIWNAETEAKIAKIEEGLAAKLIAIETEKLSEEEREKYTTELTAAATKEKGEIYADYITKKLGLDKMADATVDLISTVGAENQKALVWNLVEQEAKGVAKSLALQAIKYAATGNFAMMALAVAGAAIALGVSSYARGEKKKIEENAKRIAAEKQAALEAEQKKLEEQEKASKESKEIEENKIEYEYKQGKISIDNYLVWLKKKQSAYKEYSREWMSIQGKIDDAEKRRTEEIERQALGENKLRGAIKGSSVRTEQKEINNFYTLNVTPQFLDIRSIEPARMRDFATYLIQFLKAQEFARG